MLGSHSDSETRKKKKKIVPEPKVVAAAVFILSRGRVVRTQYTMHMGAFS